MNITEKFIERITAGKIKAKTIPTAYGVPADAVIAAAGTVQDDNQTYIYESGHGSYYCLSERMLAYAAAIKS